MSVHPYCPHDEGEPCGCAVELRAHMPDRDRRRSRKRQGAAPAETFAEICGAVDKLTAQGQTNCEIAATLGVSERTVSRARSRRAS